MEPALTAGWSALGSKGLGFNIVLCISLDHRACPFMPPLFPLAIDMHVIASRMHCACCNCGCSFGGQVLTEIFEGLHGLTYSATRSFNSVKTHPSQIGLPGRLHQYCVAAACYLHSDAVELYWRQGSATCPQQTLRILSGKLL